MKADLRYTPSTAFETFPWPTPTTTQRSAIAAAAKALLDRREALSRQEVVGLTELYNRVDDGAYTDLARLHRDLDEAVVTAYGWPRNTAQDDARLVLQLGELNAQVAGGVRQYQPFASGS